MDFKANIRKQHGFRFNDINPTGQLKLDRFGDCHLLFLLPCQSSSFPSPSSFFNNQSSLVRLGSGFSWLPWLSSVKLDYAQHLSKKYE